MSSGLVANEQRSRVDFQRARQGGEEVEGHVRLPTLDVLQVSNAASEALREDLLRESEGAPCFRRVVSETEAQGDRDSVEVPFSVRPQPRHRGDVRGLRDPWPRTNSSCQHACMLGSLRLGERVRLTVALVASVACGSSGSSPPDAGGEVDAATVEDAGLLDANGLDAAADATLDAAPSDDGGSDAGSDVDSSVEVGDSGVDAGIDPCPTGVHHEPTNRCFFLAASGGISPCPEGSRRARWADAADQTLVQSLLGSLESQSPTTSLRRRGYVSGAPWVWDDNTAAPSGLVWASTGHPSLTYAYLTPEGLVPYHTERPRTLCERSTE